MTGSRRAAETSREWIPGDLCGSARDALQPPVREPEFYLPRFSGRSLRTASPVRHISDV